jgi:hypothetical protein
MLNVEHFLLAYLTRLLMTTIYKPNSQHITCHSTNTNIYSGRSCRYQHRNEGRVNTKWNTMWYKNMQVLTTAPGSKSASDGRWCLLGIAANGEGIQGNAQHSITNTQTAVESTQEHSTRTRAEMWVSSWEHATRKMSNNFTARMWP